MATVKLDPAKGVQIPNLTTTERNAISSPETGALIWNTTTSAINQYNGSAWEATDTNTQIAGITSSADATAITIDSSEKVALGGSTAVTSDSQVAIHGGNLELTTAGARYWIPRASDGALTGSLYSPSGSVVRLSGAGTSAGTIEFEPRSSNGVIARVTADGLCFGSDTAAANALDDYEEGTHVVSATDQGGGATYGLNSGYNTFAYTKVGRLVTITGTLVNSTVTGTPTGTTKFSLPFACVNLTKQSGKSGGAGIGVYQVQKYTSGTYPQSQISEGDSFITLNWGVVNANQYMSYLNTSSQVYCNFSYFTA